MSSSSSRKVSAGTIAIKTGMSKSWVYSMLRKGYTEECLLENGRELVKDTKKYRKFFEGDLSSKLVSENIGKSVTWVNKKRREGYSLKFINENWKQLSIRNRNSLPDSRLKLDEVAEIVGRRPYWVYKKHAMGFTYEYIIAHKDDLKVESDELTKYKAEKDLERSETLAGSRLKKGKILEGLLEDSDIYKRKKKLTFNSIGNKLGVSGETIRKLVNIEGYPREYVLNNYDDILKKKGKERLYSTSTDENYIGKSEILTIHSIAKRVRKPYSWVYYLVEHGMTLQDILENSLNS